MERTCDDSCGVADRLIRIGWNERHKTSDQPKNLKNGDFTLNLQ